MASTLDGLNVLDLGTGPAAALASMFLADHGARVVRITRPGMAANRSGGYVVWDRGKDCVALDLDAARISGTTEQAAFQRLVAAADVLIEDFAPSAPLQDLVEAGLLAAINPRLVACSITAYGKYGPLKDEPPIDELVLAYTGVLSGMPGFRPPPVHVIHPLPTVGAALFACIGIAAALLARETTERGRSVATSLMAGALLYHPKVIGERLQRHVFQTNPAGSAPFYSNYECADGAWVQLGCVHVNFIATAAGLMGLGELIKEPRFDRGRGGKTPTDDAEIRAAVGAVMRSRPSAAWIVDFEAADVPFAPARQTEDGMSDGQVVHNGMVTTLADPVLGPVTQMGVPIRFSVTPGRIQGPRRHLLDRGFATPNDDPAAQRSPLPASPREADPPPLAGVRILEITNLIAGPTAGRLLADLGADVIKLEPLEGDLSRPIGRTYFYSVNFNKRSISIDTRTGAGKTAVQRIAAKADALVANLRPGATARMGISPAINPRLIETHITGYGWTGPYAHRPGIDPLAQALMGLQRAQGGPDNPPVFPAQLAPTDYTTGAMGALGTILALLERKRHGVVQRVDSDLLGGGILLSSAWFTRYAGKPSRPLADRQQMGLGPFHRLYRLADGWIYIVAETDAQRAAVVAAAGVRLPAAPITDEAGGGVHANDTPIAAALAQAFAERQLDATIAHLRRSSVPVAKVEAGDSEVFLAGRQAIANGHVAVRAHPTAGRITVAWQYIQFGASLPSSGRPTPLLGEHSAEILSEAGYSDQDAGALFAAGIVKSNRT